MSTLKKGIDVSYAQGKIDWSKLKGTVDFAIIRAGYGQGHTDKQAIRNISECMDKEIPFGLYWFSYAWSDATAINEANYLKDVVTATGAKPEYPLYFDYEGDSSDYYAKIKGVKPTDEQITNFAKMFCTTLENDCYYAGIYANKDYAQRMRGVDPDIFKRTALWFAQWQVTKPALSCGLWQYSSKGTAPGISGAVDLNYAYVDYPTPIKFYGFNGFAGKSNCDCDCGCCK